MLQSAPAPAFVLVHGVELPGSDRCLERRAHERAGTSATAPPSGDQPDSEGEPTTDGFRLRWVSRCCPTCRRWASPGTFSRAGPWYGHGERIIQPWPLDRLPVIAEPLIPYD